MDNKREQFLLHLYDQLWASIDRATGGLWQYLALYGGIVGVHWGAGKGDIAPTLAANLSIVAAFWGINIAINAGKWFERNRMMIINIEKQFLQRDDLGKIMPVSYHKRVPKTFFTFLTLSHVLVFTCFIALSLWTYWDAISSHCNSRVIALFLVLIGILLSAWHWYWSFKHVQRFVEHTASVEGP